MEENKRMRYRIVIVQEYKQYSSITTDLKLRFRTIKIFDTPAPMWRPLDLARFFSRARKRECTTWGLRRIRPLRTSLRMCAPAPQEKQNHQCHHNNEERKIIIKIEKNTAIVLRRYHVRNRTESFLNWLTVNSNDCAQTHGCWRC